MSEAVKSNGIHPAIRDHYADMNAALHNRDELVQQVNDLQSALTVANGNNSWLRDELKRMTQERDYYFRKSFAYTNTLVNMKNTVVNMLALADHEAENPPPPAQITKEETKEEATEEAIEEKWQHNQ